MATPMARLWARVSLEDVRYEREVGIRARSALASEARPGGSEAALEPGLGRRRGEAWPYDPGMKVVHTDRHRSHDPKVETYLGLPMPANEVPERAEVIRDALAADGGEPGPCGRRPPPPAHGTFELTGISARPLAIQIRAEGDHVTSWLVRSEALQPPYVICIARVRRGLSPRTPGRVSSVPAVT